MAEIVNLNRAAREAEAAANRAKHGRTGAQKLNDRREEARRRALLEGVRVDDGPKNS